MSYILIVWFVHGTMNTAPAVVGRFAAVEQCALALDAWTETTPRERFGGPFAQGMCLKTELQSEPRVPTVTELLNTPLPEFKR